MTDSTTTDDIVVHRVLDVRGFDCPIPILRTRLALREVEPGEVLHVRATDPHSVIDFRAFCARTGNVMLRLVEEEDRFEFYIRRV